MFLVGTMSPKQKDSSSKDKMTAPAEEDCDCDGGVVIWGATGVAGGRCVCACAWGAFIPAPAPGDVLL